MELSPASILAVKPHIDNPIQWKPNDEVLKKLKKATGVYKNDDFVFLCIKCIMIITRSQGALCRVRTSSCTCTPFTLQTKF